MTKKRFVAGDRPLSELLRAPRGTVELDALPTDTTPGYPGEGKEDADERSAALAPVLSELQEKLFANGRVNPDEARRVLVILQGMDTSGKGGIIRHAMGLVDPQGLHIHAFKAPNAEERAHDFLWRVTNALPEPGMIGIFDRSHYEDVLVARVDALVAPDVWEKRYDQINAWEAELAERGTAIVKCFLHIGKEEQKERLAARLDSPDKYWKYNPGDLAARSKWDAYREAYEAVLTRCDTDTAPWFVIPSDKKWYRNWAVAELLRETLAGLDLRWPEAPFDVDEQRKAVAAS